MRFRESIYHQLITLLLIINSSISYGQFEIPEKPAKANPDAVYDYIGLLTSSQKQALEQKLIRYSDTTSTQIVIAIISSTNDDDIAMVGAEWLAQWGIGQAKEDNGILITLAKDDRMVDINTGYGIEYILSDRDAERIINRVMVPQFKKGNFYAGLDQATDAIFDTLQGNYTGTRQEDTSFPIEPLIMFIVFIVIFIILSRKNRNDGHGNGGRRAAESLLDVIILSNMGRGGFGGGSSWGGGGSFGGGGGFGGGFGGGMGGGGGASGGW